mgnify:CR=1 FL=1
MHNIYRAYMGRKKNRFKCIIPKSLLEYVAVDSEGIAIKYKLAHFLSLLSYHITSNYPQGGYYLKKPVTSKYLSYLYTLRYTEQVLLPLKRDGIIVVNDSYSSDLGYCKEYSVSLDVNFVKAQAIEWQATRGARSGRVAWQFFVDWASKNEVNIEL